MEGKFLVNIRFLSILRVSQRESVQAVSVLNCSS